MTRPYRTALYIPASKPRALQKAKELTADAIIFDLEDAVAPEEKASARELLIDVLSEGGYGARAKIVRINGLDTPWGREDAKKLSGLGGKIDGLLIPKVNAPHDLHQVAEIAPGQKLWAMMETAHAMLNAAAIAAHPRLAGMVMGTNDLAKELGSRHRADRLPMLSGLGHCLLAARAHGRIILDGVYNAFKDDEGLRFECEQGRDMGFDGKTVIHPAQLEITNEAFSPSQAELDLARRQIAAFEEVAAKGEGVAVLDGKIVENLHVVAARALLAKAEAIAAF